MEIVRTLTSSIYIYDVIGFIALILHKNTKYGYRKMKLK